MSARLMQLPSAGSTSRRSRGFSFVEILFAVAVLGIGFIMLAAIFPVGLQQTKLTLDETTAAANARSAVATIAQLAQGQIQYKGPANSTDPVNLTSIFPHTFGVSPTLPALNPTIGTGPGQVPAGRSRTYPGQVRSLRDGRNFCDFGPGATVRPGANSDWLLRTNAIWNRVNSELLTNSNERNAFVVLYKRDVTYTANQAGTVLTGPIPSDNAQLIVINAQVAAQSAYTNGDVYNGTPPVIYNLEPRPVGVTIEYDGEVDGFVARFANVNGSGPPPANDRVNFTASPAYAAAPAAVAEGTYIVVSDDRISTAGSNGRMNGRIFRLGNYRTDLSAGDAYELAPGYGFAPDPGADGVFHKTGALAGQPGFDRDDVTRIGGTGNLPVNPGGRGGDGSGLATVGPAVAYVLGKGFDNVNVTPTGASGYVGTAQDVALYTTFISVK